MTLSFASGSTEKPKLQLARRLGAIATTPVRLRETLANAGINGAALGTNSIARAANRQSVGLGHLSDTFNASRNMNPLLKPVAGVASVPLGILGVGDHLLHNGKTVGTIAKDTLGLGVNTAKNAFSALAHPFTDLDKDWKKAYNMTDHAIDTTTGTVRENTYPTTRWLMKLYESMAGWKVGTGGFTPTSGLHGGGMGGAMAA